jgi:hypothetical protein
MGSGSNNRAVIIAVVVVVLLCCCCLAVGVIGWFFGDAIVEQLGLALAGGVPRL